MWLRSLDESIFIIFIYPTIERSLFIDFAYSRQDFDFCLPFSVAFIISRFLGSFLRFDLFNLVKFYNSYMRLNITRIDASVKPSLYERDDHLQATT